MGSGREGREYLHYVSRAAVTVTEGSSRAGGSRISHRPIAGWATTGLSVEWRPAAQLTSPGPSIIRPMGLHVRHPFRDREEVLPSLCDFSLTFLVS